MIRTLAKKSVEQIRSDNARLSFQSEVEWICLKSRLNDRLDRNELLRSGFEQLPQIEASRKRNRLRGENVCYCIRTENQKNFWLKNISMIYQQVHLLNTKVIGKQQKDLQINRITYSRLPKQELNNKKKYIQNDAEKYWRPIFISSIASRSTMLHFCREKHSRSQKQLFVTIIRAFNRIT